MYKVGDMVKIRKDLVVNEAYGAAVFTCNMVKYQGKCAKITDYVGGIEYRIDIDDENWNWTKEMLEPVCDNEIHITVKGLNTIAVLKENDKVVRRSVAKCNPTDEFNFEFGARLAIDRLFENNKQKTKTPFDLKGFQNTEFAVNCKTEKESKMFLEYLESKGFKWRSGQRLCSLNFWRDYKERTTYVANCRNRKTDKAVTYSRAEFYTEIFGGKFVPYSEFTFN